jgi:hypothetical protein
MSQDQTARSGWGSAAMLAAVAVAVACCLAGPAVAGLLGGAVLWGVGLPFALGVAFALAGGCYPLVSALRRRRGSAP